MSDGRGFTLVRILEAPRSTVFRAWTDPDELGWFFNDIQVDPAPAEVDLRVGGAWRQRMEVSADEAYVTGGIYLEIVPDERLVFAFGAVGGWPDLDPQRLDAGPLVTITFAELAPDRTEMTLRVDFADDLPDDRVRAWLETGMQDGWDQTIARLIARFR